MSQIKAKINGIEINVPKGTTILKAAEQHGIEIPTLCYDKRLSPYGGCKMCVVKISGVEELQTACTTEVKQGMEIETETEETTQARTKVLENMLANHPCDCLTCEKSGNCLLQDYAYKYKIKKFTYGKVPNRYNIDDSNPFIIRDNNKCILCGKCIRACKEIRKQSVLDFTNYGTETIVAPLKGKSLADSDCVYCQNCVAVCPTGALMDKYLMKKGRWWEFTKEAITCPFCANGCNFFLMKKDGKIVGVTVGEAAPGRPFCLRGRLALTLIFCEEPRKAIGTFSDIEDANWEGKIDANF